MVSSGKFWGYFSLRGDTNFGQEVGGVTLPLVLSVIGIFLFIDLFVFPFKKGT